MRGAKPPAFTRHYLPRRSPPPPPATSPPPAPPFLPPPPPASAPPDNRRPFGARRLALVPAALPGVPQGCLLAGRLGLQATLFPARGRAPRLHTPYSL